MPQSHHQRRAEPGGRELDAADLRRSDDVSGNPDDEQVAQALVEDDLRGHARVGASENDGERLLARRQLGAPRLAYERVPAPDVGHEATVACWQAFECFWRGDHRRFILVRRTPQHSASNVGCPDSDGAPARRTAFWKSRWRTDSWRWCRSSWG